ncbi:hypothetical protein EOS_05690 [Caballeronia mineralivorans PML1(12)]|uniref:Uncharacterized protein n=1 Tax=Caballeronia mineralivorans PML1(12) TaxID=908627 RepID=A0A0J1D3D2_9BURK|nr:hypothetical protein EOS_05690 [Caballeronia mineralivorans PML1(12)]
MLTSDAQGLTGSTRPHPSPTFAWLHAEYDGTSVVRVQPSKRGISSFHPSALRKGMLQHRVCIRKLLITINI